MSIKSFVLASLLAVGAVSVNASAAVVNATGDGWCDKSNFCNNTSTNVFANNDLSSTINNWQAFTLGTYGSITGATLSIYEDAGYGSFYAYGQGDINFFLATGISYSGLQTGQSIGTITNGTANGVGKYINIALNSYGVQQLNLLQGKSFVIGGSNGGSTVDAFGYSSSSSPAPYLTLQTAAAAVPEPGSIALLGLGVAGFAVARRKQSKGSKV